MATPVQRVQAICDAIINATATPEQIDHLGRSIASASGTLPAYLAMTGGQRAAFIVQHVRQYLVGIVRHQESQVAAATAATQAASGVDAAFPEA